jgi:hypothetical protein
MDRRETTQELPNSYPVDDDAVPRKPSEGRFVR